VRVFAIVIILVGLAIGAFFLFFNDPDKPAPMTAGSSSQNEGTTSSGPASGTKLKSSSSTDKLSSNNETASSGGSIKEENKPVIIEKEKSANPQTAGIAAMQRPSFDVVRVDENCGLLVAGRAEPTAIVSIFANEIKLGEVESSSRGEWVFIADKPLDAGAQKINVKAINPNKQQVETPRLVIMQVPDCSKAIETRDPAIAVLTPKPEAAANSALPDRVSKLLQVPEPKGDLSGAKDLSLGSIDYDDEGNVALSGTGQPEGSVDIYLNNRFVGSADIGEDGTWQASPENDVAPGEYQLRVDQKNKDGNVISRVEIPFKREAAEDVILAKGGLEIRAVVQPGNSLWRIARRMYGDGLQYTLIYQANEGQIRDPDLIYPGQIFKIPDN